jgi:hypothetical protein
MPVRILPKAYRQIERLPAGIHLRMLTVLERLEHWPSVSGVKPLRGDLAGKSGFARATIAFSFM